MSDHIPFQLQIDIMKKLPIKSLIQFRPVSKQWKTLIDSSDFIVDYTVRSQSQPQQHLLIWYQIGSNEDVFISIADDDHSFPQKKLSPTVPTSVKRLRSSDVIGISHGLVCVSGYTRNLDKGDYYSGTEKAVVWNPLIRKSVVIAIHNPHRQPNRSVLRFGVCPRTCDPKVVKFDRLKTVNGSINGHWQVEAHSDMFIFILCLQNKTV